MKSAPVSTPAPATAAASIPTTAPVVPLAASTAAPVARPRRVEALVRGQATSDGAGVRLTRLLTADLQRRLDPFLMLDAFGTDRADDYIAGFPDHPHRGFETVTLMVQGRMRHRDSAGNVGLLGPGSVQWMTAGRGVIHSEMPEQQDGAMEGFQLWLNLPARTKMQPPGYRDLAADDIPLWHGEQAIVRVVAGAYRGVAGAVQRPDTEPLLLDVALEAGAHFEAALPAAHNAFVCAYRGVVSIGGTAVGERRMAILETSSDVDGIAVDAGADGARFIVVAGRPLGEPIAQHGPFVMNTRDELIQAVDDFRAGRLA